MKLAQNSRPSLPQKSDPNRKLTAREFQRLADVPLVAEWFANLDNPRTRRAYGIDIREFMAFAGIVEAREDAGPLGQIVEEADRLSTAADLAGGITRQTPPARLWPDRETRPDVCHGTISPLAEPPPQRGSWRVPRRASSTPRSSSGP